MRLDEINRMLARKPFYIQVAEDSSEAVFSPEQISSLEQDPSNRYTIIINKIKRGVPLRYTQVTPGDFTKWEETYLNPITGELMRRLDTPLYQIKDFTV